MANLLLSLATLLKISLIILLTNGTEKKAKAQVLCLPQFALANEACSGLRLIPFPPPSTPSSEHHHRHHKEHHHSNIQDDLDSKCCRRLHGIDNACVCKILSRLPKFIVKPKQTITLTPSDDLICASLVIAMGVVEARVAQRITKDLLNSGGRKRRLAPIYNQKGGAVCMRACRQDGAGLQPHIEPHSASEEFRAPAFDRSG